MLKMKGNKTSEFKSLTTDTAETISSKASPGMNLVTTSSKSKTFSTGKARDNKTTSGEERSMMSVGTSKAISGMNMVPLKTVSKTFPTGKARDTKTTSGKERSRMSVGTSKFNPYATVDTQDNTGITEKERPVVNRETMNMETRKTDNKTMHIKSVTEN